MNKKDEQSVEDIIFFFELYELENERYIRQANARILKEFLVYVRILFFIYIFIAPWPFFGKTDSEGLFFFCLSILIMAAAAIMVIVLMRDLRR